MNESVVVRAYQWFVAPEVLNGEGKSHVTGYDYDLVETEEQGQLQVNNLLVYYYLVIITYDTFPKTRVKVEYQWDDANWTNETIDKKEFTSRWWRHQKIHRIKNSVPRNLKPIAVVIVHFGNISFGFTTRNWLQRPRFRGLPAAYCLAHHRHLIE